MASSSHIDEFDETKEIEVKEETVGTGSTAVF